MRIHHTLTALFVTVAASACDNTFNEPNLTPLPTSATATGFWGGTIGLTSILDISITETPPALAGNPATITGSGTLKSATCNRDVTVSGSGNSPYYTLSITETGTSTFEVVVDATLSFSGIGGPYTMAAGTAADACLPELTGFTLLGQKTTADIQGAYVGPWGLGGTAALLELNQSGTSVSGVISWNVYQCSDGAIFEGVVTGNKLVGTLKSIKPKFADFAIDVTWNSNDKTLKGPWTITKAGETFLCLPGATGDMDLSQISGPAALELDPESDSKPTHTRYHLEVDSDGTAQELLIRSR